jgi:hypothetical protein
LRKPGPSACSPRSGPAPKNPRRDERRPSGEISHAADAVRKYQGHLIADLPGNYLNWFARKGFPPGEIGQLLALMHELDHNGLSALLAPLRKK